MNTFAWTALALLLTAGLAAHCEAQPIETYRGPCDASAAVALDADHFVVADDEHDTLHVYRRGQPQAVGALALSRFLGTRDGEESDIEGAATIGSRIYWITSHGRNGKGKAQSSRHRLFATELRPGQSPTVEPVGRPYVHLLRDMAASDALEPYRLDAAARLAAEADGGLNIEGLAAMPDGGLLIGLRNPLPRGRALVVPLRNPGDVINGMPARFGTPIELDLGQRGIRSIELVGGSYLIVAGPPTNRGSFALNRWSGQPGDVAVVIEGVDLKGLRPEALFEIPHTGRVQLLSDDGGVKMGGIECKRRPASQQTFRSLTVTPPR
jgi:hypothetical protein